MSWELWHQGDFQRGTWEIYCLIYHQMLTQAQGYKTVKNQTCVISPTDWWNFWPLSRGNLLGSVKWEGVVLRRLILSQLQGVEYSKGLLAITKEPPLHNHIGHEAHTVQCEECNAEPLLHSTVYHMTLPAWLQLTRPGINAWPCWANQSNQIL